MVVLSFKTKKDKEHMLRKAKEMQLYVDDYVECLEDAVYEDDEYAERRGSKMRLKDRYSDMEEPHYRMR